MPNASASMPRTTHSWRGAVVLSGLLQQGAESRQAGRCRRSRHPGTAARSSRQAHILCERQIAYRHNRHQHVQRNHETHCGEIGFRQRAGRVADIVRRVGNEFEAFVGYEDDHAAAHRAPQGLWTRASQQPIPPPSAGSPSAAEAPGPRWLQPAAPRAEQAPRRGRCGRHDFPAPYRQRDRHER